MRLIEKADTSGIKVHNLGAQRGNRQLFSGISFSLKPGKSLRLVGPNGCGKSTLLRLLAGRLKPTTGSVQGLDDVLLLNHQLMMKDRLTVEENLTFWAEVYQASLSTACVRMGLTTLLPLPFSVLSCGQKKRTQLALLYLNPAKVWLLDEPLLSLDHNYSIRLGEAIQEHLNQGGIVVYASHDPIPNVISQTLDLSQEAANVYDAA